MARLLFIQIHEPMNIILLEQSDFVGDKNEVVLSGRRFMHIKDILKSSVGDTLSIGLLNDRLGEGEVMAMSANDVHLKVDLTEPPPPALSCKLILALPRPIVLKRLLGSITSLGIKEIYLLQTRRVEKSYWQSPVLEKQNIEKALKLGLEQSKDTVLPKIFLKKQFKSFVEDELSDIVQGTQCFFAHPTSREQPQKMQGPVTLAVGPEGGFIDYEIEKLQQYGFSGIHLGQRILKVETAIHVLIGQLRLLI